MTLDKIKNITAKEIAGFSVYTIEETESTNDDVLAMAKAGAPANLVLLAERQTKGRGRMTRRWVSKANQSLTATLLLRPTLAEQGFLLRFTALAGLALLDALEKSYGLKGQVKWPNDVLLDGAKVCGILTETLWVSNYAEAVAVGIGVNLGESAYETNETLRFKATSLEAQIGRLVPVDEILESLLTSIVKLRPGIGDADFIARWNKHLAYVGERVQIANEKGETEWVRLMGIQENAALLVEGEQGGLRQLYASEITPFSP